MGAGTASATHLDDDEVEFDDAEFEDDDAEADNNETDVENNDTELDIEGGVEVGGDTANTESTSDAIEIEGVTYDIEVDVDAEVERPGDSIEVEEDDFDVEVDRGAAQVESSSSTIEVTL